MLCTRVVSNTNSYGKRKKKHHSMYVVRLLLDANGKNDLVISTNVLLKVSMCDQSEVHFIEHRSGEVPRPSEIMTIRDIAVLYLYELVKFSKWAKAAPNLHHRVHNMYLLGTKIEIAPNWIS